MSDLIDRLRSQNVGDFTPVEIDDLTDEALEALEAANARIADLLTQLEQKELARYTLAVGYEHAIKRAADLEAQIAAANAREPVAWKITTPEAGNVWFTEARFQMQHFAYQGHAVVPLFTTPQPTPSAIEAWSALIANSLLGQQKKEDVEEVERLIYELLGVKY